MKTMTESSNIRSHNVDTTKRVVTHVSHCYGYGGIDLGLQRVFGASVVTIAACEIEAFAIQNGITKSEAGLLDGNVPFHTNIKSFPFGKFRGLVDIYSAGFPCFAAGTLILTRDGYKPIEEIIVGDRVLTHKGRWKRVNATMYRRNAALRRVEAQGCPGIITTDAHPFFARKPKRIGHFSKRTFMSPEWVAAKDIRGTHIGQVLPDCNDKDEHDETFWWVVGRYLADGWRVDRLDRESGGRVVICCNKRERKELESRLCRAGFHGTPSEERTVIKYHICCNWFYDFLKQFGHKAGGKTVPGFVYELPEHKAKALLEGYFTGDGYRDRLDRRATTVSKRLALGVALLVQRAYGVVATVRKCKVPRKKIIEGRIVNQQDFYVVGAPDHNRSAFVEGKYGWKLARKSYPAGIGTVYNIGVEGDESYVADGAIVHNCQPFSCAGARKATEDPRHLFPYIRKGLEEMQPEWVFLENVDGIISARIKGDGWADPEGTPILLHVLRELERVGYIPEAGVFSASEAGAPHQRKRTFILGRRKAGWDHNQLPVLSVADGQCWGCPVWADEAQWEAMRGRMVGIVTGCSPDSGKAGQDMADTNHNGHGGESQSGITNEASTVGTSGTGAVDIPRQMGDTSSCGCQLRQDEHGVQDTAVRQKRISSTGTSSGELADPGAVRCDGGTIQDSIEERKVRELSQPQGGKPCSARCEAERCRGNHRGEELEHAEHDGLPTNEVPGSIDESGNGAAEGQDATGNLEGASRPCSMRDLWPSRPGEAQGLWEPPRVTGGAAVVSDTTGAGQLRAEESEDEGEDSGRGRGPDTSDLCGSDGEEETGEGSDAGEEDGLPATPEGHVADPKSKRNIRIRGNSEEADGTPEGGRSPDRGNGELDRPSKEGTMEDSLREGPSSKRGKVHREKAIQSPSAVSTSGGDTGKVVCGNCGFKNAIKWGRTKCLVCGKEMADPVNDGRMQDGQGGRPGSMESIGSQEGGTGHQQAVSAEHSSQGPEKLADTEHLGRSSVSRHEGTAHAESGNLGSGTDQGKKLDNPEHAGPQGGQVVRERMGKGRSGREANPSNSSTPAVTSGDNGTPGGKELADNSSIGCEPEPRAGNGIARETTGEGTTDSSGSGNNEGTRWRDIRTGPNEDGEDLEDADGSGNTQPADQQPDIPSEPSGGDGEDLGNAGSEGLQGSEGSGSAEPEGEPAGHPAEPVGNMGDTPAEGLQERQESGQSQPVQAVEQPVGGHETGELANSQCERGPARDGEREEYRGEREGNATAPSSEESIREGGQGQPETEPEMGGNPDGTPLGLVLSEYTGLSYSELEEIFNWMRSGRSRVEELRLLGNGVVPQCAEKAFRTLYARLDKPLE